VLIGDLDVDLWTVLMQIRGPFIHHGQEEVWGTPELCGHNVNLRNIISWGSPQLVAIICQRF